MAAQGWFTSRFPFPTLTSLMIVDIGFSAVTSLLVLVVDGAYRSSVL
jgi:hypothetical protein